MGDFGLLERRIGLSVIDKKNLKFIIFRYLFGSQKKRKIGANVSGALYYRSFWPLQTSLSPLRGTRNQWPGVMNCGLFSRVQTSGLRSHGSTCCIAYILLASLRVKYTIESVHSIPFFGFLRASLD